MSHKMRYAKIAGVDKPVSRIIYGTAAMPFLAGGDGNAILDAMFALGVNTFDTARNYAFAEKSLGQWITDRGNRDQVVILSKCAHPGPDGTKRVDERSIREDFSVSSQLLNTNYIDIYLLHRDDPNVPAGTVVEIMNALHAEGKIGAFGGSNWTHQRIEAANEYAYAHNLIPFTVSSPNFGLADQQTDPWGGGCISISGPGNANAREWYAENRIPVVAYSSLGRGMFSGKVKSTDATRVREILDPVAVKGYASPENFRRLERCEALAAEKGCSVAQLAMAWIYNQPMQALAVVSTKSEARMQENIDALRISLTEEELRYLDLVGE